MQPPDRAMRMFGLAVHVLTASGAACALLALVAAIDHAWSATFAWLGVALVVDAVDGPLARRAAVSERLPRWSGATLDLVVDFVTYVFVPAFAVAASGLLPPLLATAAGAAIVVTGALYFADRNMKRPDHSFSGFPALWNVAAFYLLVLRPPPTVTAAIIACLCIATFAPCSFIHPVRVVRLRPLTLAVLAVWAVLAVITLGRDLSPGPWITSALCGIACYVVAVGLWPTKATDQG